jgi:hypothetical protein
MSHFAASGARSHNRAYRPIAPRRASMTRIGATDNCDSEAGMLVRIAPGGFKRPTELLPRTG